MTINESAVSQSGQIPHQRRTFLIKALVIANCLENYEWLPVIQNICLPEKNDFEGVIRGSFCSHIRGQVFGRFRIDDITVNNHKWTITRNLSQITMFMFTKL